MSHSRCARLQLTPGNHLSSSHPHPIPMQPSLPLATDNFLIDSSCRLFLLLPGDSANISFLFLPVIHLTSDYSFPSRYPCHHPSSHTPFSSPFTPPGPRRITTDLSWRRKCNLERGKGSTKCSDWPETTPIYYYHCIHGSRIRKIFVCKSSPSIGTPSNRGDAWAW